MGERTGNNWTKFPTLRNSPSSLGRAELEAIEEAIDNSAPIASAVGFVQISNPSTDVRPTGYGTIFWIGGEVQPLNMAEGDVWLSGGDVVASGETPVAPTILTTALNALTVNVPFSQTLSISGTTPITVAVTTGALPTGLTLSGSTISGTPTVEGAYSFTVTAENSAGTYQTAFSGTVGTVASVATYSIFDTTTPGNGGTWQTESQAAAIEVANGFYTTGSSVTITGLRYWVPTGADLTRDVTLRIRLFDWAGSLPTGSAIFATAVSETISLTANSVAGWNEASLVTPIVLPAISGSTGTPDFAVVSVEFSGNDSYYAGSFGIAGATELASADDASTKIAISSEGRGFYQMSGSAGTTENYYGLDILFEV